MDSWKPAFRIQVSEYALRTRPSSLRNFARWGATTRGVKEGTGLGLAITKKLVEQQGDKIGHSRY